MYQQRSINRLPLINRISALTKSFSAEKPQKLISNLLKYFPQIFIANIPSLFCLLILLFPAASSAFFNGGDQLWAYRDKIDGQSGKPGKQNPVASVSDSEGNIIITGSQLLPGSSFEEFYTVKVRANGSIAWRAVYTVSGLNARAVAITVDASDNVYVTGVNDGSNNNIHTLRYNRDQAGLDATPAWQQTFDGGGTDKAAAITVSGSYVYVGGSSRYGGNECFMVLAYNKDSGALSWQIPNASTATIGKANSLAADANSIAVTGQSWNGPENYLKTIAYNPDGQSILWQTPQPDAAGYQRNDAGLAVQIDSKGHVVVAGTIYNGLNTDIHAVKYCSSAVAPCDGKTAGDILWQQTYDGGSDDDFNYLQLERGATAKDDVYLTGHTLLNGRNHMYTARYNSAVTVPQESWHATFSSGGDNTDIPAMLVVDPGADNLFVAGYSANVAFNSDFRAIKYRKSTGDELWTQTFHGIANATDRAVGAGLDTNGNLNVAGYADESAALDGGTATATAGTKGTLVNGLKTWGTNVWTGYYLKMLTGVNNSNQFRQIQSNDATTLNFSPLLPDVVNNGDGYYLYDKDDYDYYVVKYDKGVLNAPTKLVASGVSGTTVNLAWQDNNVTTPKFRVERCSAGTEHLVAVPCDFADQGQITVIDVVDGAVSMQATGLDPDKYYYFRVRAYLGADFPTATQVTYPSSTEHTVTQTVALVPEAESYSYAGVANSDDYALTISTGPINGHPVVSGKSFFTGSGFDYYTLRLDKDNLTKLWSQRYNGPESQGDAAMCLAVDHNDQVIVSGYSMLQNLVASKDMNSIYTIKYKVDAPSTPENDEEYYDWAHQYNGAGAVDDRPIAIAAASDASNNIAVVGMGVHSEANMSNHDIYVLHYPPAGPGPAGTPNPGYWAAAAIEKGGDDEPTSVAIDPSGNVLVTGFTMNTTRERKDYDIYTAKFAATNGALLWERVYDAGYGDDEANSVATDAYGNVYITGFATNADGNRDYITIKYDADGAIQWGGPTLYDGPAHGDDEAVSVKVDPMDNHIVVSGNRLTDAGNNDVHTIRYAPDGNIDWQKTLLRERNDEDMFDMAMDTSGSVHIAATTTNSDNNDPLSNQDILAVKLDWQGIMASNATSYGQIAELDKPYGIAVNYQGDAFIAGISQNAALNADYIVLKVNGDNVQSPYPMSTSNPTYTSVKLDWTDSSKAEDGFQVARRDGACPAEPPVWGDGEIITSGPAHLAANTVTFTDTGRTSRATYCYGVRAFSGTTYSRWTNNTVTMVTPPAPSVSVAAATTKVTVSWTPQNGGQQTGFELWRCSDTTSAACTDYALLTSSLTGAATSYDDLTVCAGTIYRYKLKAKDGTDWASDFSTPVGAIPATVDNLAVDQGFEAPTPMTAGQSVGWTNVGGTIATDITFDTAEKHSGAQSLNINAVGTTSMSGIKQYLLFSPGGKYQISAWFKTAAPAGKATCDLLDAGSGSFSNSGTTSDWEQRSLTITASTASFPGGSRIRCFVNTGSQANIDDLQATPLYDLTATRFSETQIDLAWLDSSYDETGYKVERCNDAGCTSPQLIATLGADVRSYRDSRLTPDTTYWYRVRPYKTAPLSCNGGWDGSYSNIASALTTNNPPILTASAANTTQVNLTWSDTAGTENLFQIERCIAASCSMTNIASLLANATTYTDANACSNTLYSYQVRAVDQPLSFGGANPWTKRVKLDFGTTFSANKLTRITINQLTGMDASFKDIRFYDATAKQELSHWIEPSAAGSATAWIKTGSNNDIYLYFGNNTAISTSSSSNVFGKALVGFWPFNEAAETRSGTTADISGNALNATLNYFYSYTGYGVVAGGRYKNGLNLGLQSSMSASVADITGSLLDITDQITIELWYQYQKSPDWGRLASKMTTDTGQPWEMYGLWLDNTTDAVATNPQQRVYFGIGSQDSPPGGAWPYFQSDAGPQLTPGQWYHIVGRYDSASGRMSVFVNGIEYGVATHATKPKIVVNNAPFYIGNRGTGNYMKGMLDEVRLYNRALSDEEIASRYAATLPVVTVPIDGSVQTDAGGYTFSTNWNGPYSKPNASAPAPAPSVVVTPKPANLVADPDFANGSASWATAVGTTTGTSFDTSVTYSGAKSLKFAATGATLGVSQVVTVVPNTDYTLSGYLKTSLTAGQIQCDVNGTGIDSPGILSSGTSNWTYKNENVTIPAGTTSVSIRCFGNGSPQGSAWIDMVQLVPVIPFTNFTATRKSEEQIDLTWTYPTGGDQTGFRIDRCTDSGCAAATTIAVLNAAVSTATPGNWKYSDNNLTINTNYWYRVRAYKTEDASCNGGKGYWETVSTPISGVVNTALNVPGTLTGTPAVTTACEDLRVTDTSGMAQKFYLENSMPLSACNTLNTKLIVKIPSITTAGKTLNLYYGNLKAPRGDDDGTNVFNFFDDFNGTAIDTAKWKIMNGTGFTVSNGLLHGTNTWGRLGSVITTFYGSGWNLQAKVKSTLRPASGYYPIGFSLEGNHYRSFGLIDYPAAHHYSNNNDAWTANLTTPPTGSSRDDSMVYSVVLKSSTLITPSIFDIDKNVTYWAPGDVANSNHTGDWNITIGQRYDNGGTGQAYSADWDWVRIRKYIANAPVAGAPGAVASGTYSLTGESSTWRFLSPVSVSNASGATQTDFQVNIVTDTTHLATDRNSLVWTAATDTETGFVLERCKNSLESCTANFVIDTPIPALPPKNSIGAQVTYLDRELQLDSPTTAISYCYRVKAIKSGGWLSAPTPGETGYSNIVCMNTKIQAAPTNFIGTATGTAVNLSWTDNTTGENGFTLERCQDIGGDTPCTFAAGNITTISLPPNDDKVSTTATYTDPNLCAGTYRYRISVHKNNPDGTSWTMGPTYLTGDSVATDLPPVPLNLVAARVSENQIQVTWKDMTADETGFEVWRCVGSTCTDFAKLPVTVAASGGTGATVTYNDTYYIVPETTYRYKVRAYVIATCTVYSNFSADNSASAPNGPDYATAASIAPSAVTATAVNSTQADLAWTDNTVSKSNIIVGRCPGTAPCQTSYTQFSPLSSSAVTYSDTSVCTDMVYNYQIYPTVNTAMTPLADGQIWRGVSPLTITNFQPNFITRVVITKGTMDIQDDFRNIRFIDRNAQVALPYWIQSTSGTGSAAKAIVWFKTGANSIIDLYYGNATATSASNKDAVFGTGMVGYWPFEETTQLPTTTADVSGSGNNLTMTGFTAPNGIVATGKIGNALSLDGAGDYAYKSGANTSLPAGNPATASVEAWVYPTWDPALPALTTRSPYDYNGIVAWGNRTCNGGGFAMSLTSSARPQFAGWCNDYSSPGAALTPSTWNHLAVVINGTSAITYYVNGTPISGTLSGGVPLNLASTNLAIGALELASGNRNFKGMIDEVRIYNRALTAQDVAARYAAAPPSVSVGANSATGNPGAASTINLVVPHSANMIANGEFDGTLSTKWVAWPDWNNITQDSAIFYSGSKAVKLSKALAANSAVTIYQSITNLIPGGKYILSGSIKSSLGSTGDSWCRLANGAAAVNYYSPTINIPATDAARNNQGWFRLSVPITLPLIAPGGGSISTLNLECGIWTTTAGTQTAYFDAVQLVPDPPIVLTAAQASEVDVDLNWNDFFSDETGYNIYRCQGASCTPSAVVKQLGAGIVKYRDSGLTPGENYSYKVTAYKTATCPWESTASEVKTVSTAQIAPDLLSVTPINSTKMRLTWTDMTATETGFNIERCEGASCTTGSPVYTEIYHNISPVRPLEDSLKARYSMNGNTNDSSSSGLNLKPYYNSATYEDGGVVMTSDANLYTTTTSNILDTDYHTIEFDIKFRSTAGGADIMRFAVPGANYSPGLSTSSNRISWYNYPSGAAVTFGTNGLNGTPFVVGNWYRIRGVKNGSSLKIYVDENLVVTATVSNPKTAGSGTLYFGSWYTPDILLKNVSIYNTSNAPTLRTIDDNQVCPGITYYYRVSANKQGGWGQGPTSNVRNNTTMAFNAPRAPFTATTVNDVKINLSWVANTENDQENFILKECPGASCADGMSVPNNTVLSRTGLTPETNYCYQVASWKSSAYCNGGVGLTSPFTSASACPTTHTARAGNLTAKALNANKILLEWDDMSGDEDKFLIQRKIWNGQWIVREVSAKTTGTGTKHTFTDTIAIEQLKKYTYRIVAVKGSIESPPSNEAVVSYTDPSNGQTISTTPVFSGGMDKATCICTVQDGKEVCK